MLEGRGLGILGKEFLTNLKEAPVLAGISDLFHGGSSLLTIKLLHVNHWELHLSLIFLLLSKVLKLDA